MYIPSGAEIDRLCSTYDIPVGEGELDGIRTNLEQFLRDVDDIETLSMETVQPDCADREWWLPDTDADPYNAVNFECHVPPTDGDGGLLSGMEVGLKDVIAVGGVPMEGGSGVLAGFVPQLDATITRRLRDEGATITAKLNLDQLAGSARGTTGNRGPVYNPHDADRTAGGSSGGSAAAVQTNQVDIAIGTDTGGSVRIPAAFCGVAAIKPTYGVVPLTGIVENTYTQDHPGIFATEIEKLKASLECLAGRDPADPASVQAAGHPKYSIGGYVDATPPEPEAVTIGVLQEGFGSGVREEVEDEIYRVLDDLGRDGMTIERVSVPHFEFGKPIKNILSFCELTAHWRDRAAPLRRGGTVDEAYQAAFSRGAKGATVSDLHPFYKSKLLAGATVLEQTGGRYYTRAQNAREFLHAEFVSALEGVDILAFPTMPDVAPRIADADTPGFDYARNTRAADVTRLPALTVPAGTVDGLPIGLQLMSESFTERKLLAHASTIVDRL
ncbi:MAG: amidase family protein [Halobacteriota archaeon]